MKSGHRKWKTAKCQEVFLSGPKAVTAYGPDTHPSGLHINSKQQQLEKQTAYVVTKATVVSSWLWA